MPLGETVPQKLHPGLELERHAIVRLNRGVAMATDKGDHGSSQLLEGIVHGAEAHAEWLETQLELPQLGETLYLAGQSGS